MKTSQKNFIRAVAILMGTIIGAGMFGIPYTVSKSGLGVGLIMLVILGLVMILLNLAYGEVILRTNGKHQFTGYAEKYLGKRGKIFALIAALSGIYGGLIAYIIKVGELINFLLPLGDVVTPFFWSLLFFATVALAVFIGLKLISKLDSILTFVLIITFSVVSILLIPQIKNVNLFSWSHNFEDLFLPYGVILFSLGGTSILGEVKSVLEDKKRFRFAIIIGTVIPIILYFIFTFMIVNVTGLETSDDSIRGLEKINPLFSHLVAILAIIGMTTSFLGIATIAKHIFHQDFKLPYLWSWLLAIFPPFIIFCLGLKSFILVIGISGSVMAGLEGVLIMLMHGEAKKKGNQDSNYEIIFPVLIKYFLISIFILGFIYEIYHLIF